MGAGSFHLAEPLTVAENVTLEEAAQISIQEGPILDSFSRFRVAIPQTIFPGQMLFDESNLHWETISNNTLSYFDPNEHGYNMKIDNVSGSFCIRQTKKYWRSVSGQSQQFFFSFLSSDLKQNLIQRIGCFDDEEGLFFEINGNNLGIVERSKATGNIIDTVIPQNEWNVDRLDGTGPSNLTLDINKLQFLVIETQDPRCGSRKYGFIIDNKVIYIQGGASANIKSIHCMSAPLIPLRFEIRNIDNTNSFSQLKQFSSGIIYEQQMNFEKTLNSISVNSAFASTATLTSILSLRLKQQYKRLYLEPNSIEVVNTGSGLTYWALLLNPSFSSSLTWSDGGRICEKSITRTNIVAPGHQIISGFLERNNIFRELNDIIGLTSNYFGVSDILTLAVKKMSGTNSILASINFKYLY